MKTRTLLATFLISGLLGFLAGTVLGLIIGVNIAKPEPTIEKVEITSRIVLERIQDQSFLITRTLISDQEATIKIDQGSAWSNFWWGHEITANGSMQVDLGVDLQKTEEDDISIDTENKIIYLTLPNAEVFNSSLKGEIEVKTSSGPLKKLLATDNNEDYNLALEKLTEQARNAALDDQEMMDEARTSALTTLQILIDETEYTIQERTQQ